MRGRAIVKKGHMALVALALMSSVVTVADQAQAAVVAVDTLAIGQSMPAGHCLTSNNKEYWVCLETDGNLVLGSHGTPMWMSGTTGTDATLVFQKDGDVVLKAGGATMWSTGTSGHTMTTLVMQNNGNLVLFNGDIAMWSVTTDYAAQIADFRAWALDPANWNATTDGDVPGIDLFINTDGTVTDPPDATTQCFKLARAWAVRLGKPPDFVGTDDAATPKPGWVAVGTDLNDALPGDVITGIWGVHTAIVVSAPSNGSIDLLEQNPNSPAVDTYNTTTVGVVWRPEVAGTLTTGQHIMGGHQPCCSDVPNQVTFESAGGSSVPTWNLGSDVPLGTLPTPTRSGYTFDGWYTDATGGTEESADTVLTTDTVLYAHWTASALATVVDELAIPGLTPPVSGGHPVTSVDIDEYSGTVTWSPADDPFAAATQYTATVTLTAKPGFTLTGVAADSFTVAGADTVTNAANSGKVTVTFPQTAPAPSTPAVVDELDIQGVTPPVTDDSPVSSINTDQYWGTVTWSPADDPFAELTIYTATVTLTPKPGFTLTGVAADSFTVLDATSVTNAANSGKVTATFPATGPGPISSIPVDTLDVPGVTTPVAGEHPVTSVDTSEYTGTVTWSPADDPFADGTTYTATVTLTPKIGYTLTGVAANSFKVIGATTTTNPQDSGVITAVFEAPAPVITPEPSIPIIVDVPGVTAPMTGAHPVTSLDAAEYTGTVSWSPADDPFVAGTAYTATITLTPKSGYTFTGLAANDFTIAGATTVTNAADSGVITATFPATTRLAPPPPVTPTLTVTPSGQTVTITGTNWVPGESVHLTVPAASLDLGTVTARADGTLPPVTFTVPAGVDPGSLQVVAVGTSSGTLQTPLTTGTVQPITASESTGTIQMTTGGQTAPLSSAWLLLFGTILTGAGVLVLRARLRRN
ncbi:MAG: InlB B-repeat-containing protein [Propionibacteriaceae bacterium]|nr:InlB B-repeat-containing protein [Propionibacteriaceae bacterium]